MLPRTNRRRDCRLPARRGYTLVEVVVSVAMVSVIMAGAASALLIALRGIDGSASNAVRARQANEALDQITSDLQVAVGVVERTTTSMAVTVADRNGDGQPETIRYAWSGVSGDPLTRSVNGGAAESIADNVTYFNIDSLLATYGPIESQEMVLTSFDSSAGGTLKDWNVTAAHPCACYFKPVLPVNCVSWKVTRVKFCAKQSGATTQTLAVDIRTADTSKAPTATVLESHSVAESALGVAYGWYEIQLMNVAGLSPTAGYCLEIRETTSSGTAAVVQYQQNGQLNSDAWWVTSTNSGSTWTASATSEMRYYVYGTVSTQGPPLWP